MTREEEVIHNMNEKIPRRFKKALKKYLKRMKPGGVLAVTKGHRAYYCVLRNNRFMIVRPRYTEKIF